MKRIIQIALAVWLGFVGVVAFAGLETVTHISDLNSSWPLGSDLASTSDDHIRNIKVALKTDFPNINAAVTGTPTQLNNLASNISFSGTTAIASAFSVNSSTVPADGIYAPSANVLGFATNTLARGSISSAGAWSISTPTSGTALTVNSVSAGTAFAISDGTVGFNIGTGSTSLQLGTSTAHTVSVFTNNATRLSINSSGAFTISQPTSGTALGITATSAAAALALTGSGSGVEVLTINNSAGDTRVGLSSSGTEYGLLQATTNVLNVSAQGASTVLNLSTNAGTTVQLSAAGAISGRGPVAAALVDMTPDTGTFTATYTGFSAGTTCTAKWSRTGNVVVLVFCVGTNTSNAATFTMTGLPSAIQPATTQWLALAPGAIRDNGVVLNTPSATVTASSGTVTFNNGSNASGWTSSGTKGFASAASASYLLN